MKRHIIWIDPDINGEENKAYYNELKSLKFNIIREETVEEAMKKIYDIIFEDVFIIVSGSLFLQFYYEFKKNLYKISLVPKIVIFTSNVNAFINSLGRDQNIINNKFYNIGGIKTDFGEVKQFIEEESLKKNRDLIHNDQQISLNFDYIDSKDNLVLPLFFKYLIQFSVQDYGFYKFLHDNYYNKSNEITHFLDSISDLSDIPIEVLSRYYVRIYSEESKFCYELNQNLRMGHRDEYLPYIKTLYEGIKLKALPYSIEDTLYRGTQLPDKEINIMKENKDKGEIKDLPGAIVYSRSFLSFSKKKEIALGFMDKNKRANNFSKVLFILKKDKEFDYSSSTHVDVGKLSIFQNEEEVLFFPFSSFKIEKIDPKDGFINIELTYLTKYFEIYEKDFTTLSKKIDKKNVNFNKEIFQDNLIKIDENTPIKPIELMENYNSYRIDIKPPNPTPITKSKTNYLIRRIELEDKDKFYHFFPPKSYLPQPSSALDKNYITGTFLITERDINQNIRIINSFENSKRKNNYIKVQNELKYNNEKEIMNNCEIDINGYKINKFTYFVRFHSPGEYKINYKFKSILQRIDFMFAECIKLKQIDLSNFYSKEVTNMSCMFRQCISLDAYILNIDTQNVIDMSGMFYGCESITKLDLSNFNTQNVENMSLLFCGCKSLENINLSRFNTQNVKDMYCMFSGCANLKYLDLVNFYTQNVINMNRMFSECASLQKLNLSNFYTNKVQYMNSMFNGCSSLSKLDISNFSVESIINFDDMFRGCFSLRIENINCKIKNILIRRCHLNN